MAVYGCPLRKSHILCYNMFRECLTVDKKVLVAADTGIRYASVAGDYFPQHLYPWSARPLGFKLPIAQGMWIIERVIAAVQEGELLMYGSIKDILHNIIMRQMSMGFNRLSLAVYNIIGNCE